MFQQLKNKGVISRPVDGQGNGSINIIGAGTVIDGEIRSNGDIRIDGTIRGSVTSKAKVVVGSTGIIEGDVIGQNADISGAIKGKITVSEMLFLKSSARINGDILTGKLVVEVGASFTGNCNMGPVIKDIKHVDRPSKNSPKKRLENYTRYSAMGLQMGATIFLFTYGGVKLDHYLNLKFPAFTLSLSLFSVTGVLWYFIRDFMPEKNDKKKIK